MSVRRNRDSGSGRMGFICERVLSHYKKQKRFGRELMVKGGGRKEEGKGKTGVSREEFARTSVRCGPSGVNGAPRMTVVVNLEARCEWDAGGHS